MSQKIDAIKAELTKLSDSAFEKFANWVYKQSTKRDYDAHADDSNGISHRDVLRAFKKHFQISRVSSHISEGSEGGVCMAYFYESVRVKGCAFKNDADMMLVEWGPEKNGEFRLAYTRQLIPPLPNGDDQIWQLALDMRFPISENLKKLGEGTRWFRSLRDHHKLVLFVYKSRVGRAIHEMKPKRVSLTYRDVE